MTRMHLEQVGVGQEFHTLITSKWGIVLDLPRKPGAGVPVRLETPEGIYQDRTLARDMIVAVAS